MIGPMRFADVPAGEAAYKLIYPNEILSPNILVWTEETWTPVSEGLPEDGVGVLVAIRGMREALRGSWNRKYGWYVDGTNSGVILPVYAWRPLPLPPLPEDHA